MLLILSVSDLCFCEALWSRGFESYNRNVLLSAVVYTMNLCTNVFTLCVGFVAIPKNPPCRPRLQHNEPWLCRTDYTQSHCYSPRSSAHTNTTTHWTDSAPQTATPAFQPTVCLKCSSVNPHNSEQKTALERDGWAGELCMPDILDVWGQRTKHPRLENIGQAERRFLQRTTVVFVQRGRIISQGYAQTIRSFCLLNLHLQTEECRDVFMSTPSLSAAAHTLVIKTEVTLGAALIMEKPNL